MQRYPRDLRGHGPNAPDPHWPGGARIAVQFVLNYEEGGENCVLHGDPASEAFLSDIPGATPWHGQRHWNMESIYDYGARAGFWRVHRLFTGAGIPLTIYGVASALARSPEQVAAMQEADWEIASHGLKWVEHKDMPEEEERAAIAEAIRLHEEVTGTPPRGWYTGRCSTNTVRLAAETGQFAYISDTYDDDLPHWVQVDGRDQLIIPYTLECNDMRFATSPGWITGEQFESYLRDTFDTLYAEGAASAPKMMTVGLHCRLIGRPGKIAGLRRFIEHIQGFDGVWCPRRIDIAEHWAKVHPPKRQERPSEPMRLSWARRMIARQACITHSAARFGRHVARSDCASCARIPIWPENWPLPDASAPRARRNRQARASTASAMQTAPPSNGSTPTTWRGTAFPSSSRCATTTPPAFAPRWSGGWPRTARPSSPRLAVRSNASPPCACRTCWHEPPSPAHRGTVDRFGVRPLR